VTDRVDLSAQLLRADAPLPDALRSLAARLAPDSRVVPVWRNGLGGLTVRLDPHRARSSLILKWSPPGREVALADERARLDWAGRYHPVPRVLDAGEADDGAGGSAEWMLTAALPGDSAVSDRWRADPRTAVRAIGTGLRRLHEALPVAECPFVGPRLDGEPAVEHPVVAHGDACAPNTLLDAEGAFLAHVDLGALGGADRWSDLAIASMSLEWNYGAGWEETFFDAYGIERDERLIRRWRARWNADSEPAGGGGSAVGGSL
jgi:kanamycin kinase